MFSRPVSRLVRVRTGAVTLAGIVLAVAAAASPAQAATYTVTNVSDVNAGSLRRAMS